MVGLLWIFLEVNDSVKGHTRQGLGLGEGGGRGKGSTLYEGYFSLACLKLFCLEHKRAWKVFKFSPIPWAWCLPPLLLSLSLLFFFCLFPSFAPLLYFFPLLIVLSSTPSFSLLPHVCNICHMHFSFFISLCRLGEKKSEDCVMNTLHINLIFPGWYLLYITLRRQEKRVHCQGFSQGGLQRKQNPRGRSALTPLPHRISCTAFYMTRSLPTIPRPHGTPRRDQLKHILV